MTVDASGKPLRSGRGTSAPEPVAEEPAVVDAVDERLDAALARRGLARSRTHAARLT